MTKSAFDLPEYEINDGIKIWLPNNFIEYVYYFLFMKSIDAWTLALNRTMLLHPDEYGDNQQPVYCFDGRKITTPEDMDAEIQNINELYGLNHFTLPNKKTTMKELDNVFHVSNSKKTFAFLYVFDMKISYLVKHLRTTGITKNLDGLEKNLKILLVRRLRLVGGENISETLDLLNIKDYQEALQDRKKLLKKEIPYADLLANATFLYAELREILLKLYKTDKSMIEMFNQVTNWCTIEGQREAIYKYMKMCGNGGLKKELQFSKPNYDKGKKIIEKAYNTHNDTTLSMEKLFWEVQADLQTEEYQDLQQHFSAYSDKKSIIKFLKELDKKHNIDRKANRKAAIETNKKKAKKKSS